MIQKLIGKKRPKLFRMTKKREMAIGDFIGSLRNHANHKDGFTREMLEFAPNISPEDFAVRLRRLNEDVEKLQEAVDVIITVSNHHQAYLLELWHMQERDWQNEWDIPLEVFERGIQTAIAFIEDSKSLANKRLSKYDDAILVLQEMLAFRKNGEPELEGLA